MCLWMTGVECRCLHTTGPVHTTPMVASTTIRAAGGSLDFIRIFLYKKQPNHFHTVLLYNRGTEPQIILFYHPGEVQVPQGRGTLLRVCVGPVRPVGGLYRDFL